MRHDFSSKGFFLRLRLSYDTLNSNFISEGYNLKAQTQFNLFYSGRQSAKEDKLYVDLVSNFYTGANPLKQKALLALQEEFVQHINKTVDKSKNSDNFLIHFDHYILVPKLFYNLSYKHY